MPNTDAPEFVQAAVALLTAATAVVKAADDDAQLSELYELVYPVIDDVIDGRYDRARHLIVTTAMLAATLGLEQIPAFERGLRAMGAAMVGTVPSMSDSDGSHGDGTVDEREN